MYKIKTYNKISKTGLDVFDDKYTVGARLRMPTAP